MPSREDVIFSQVRLLSFNKKNKEKLFPVLCYYLFMYSADFADAEIFKKKIL